MQQRKLSQIFSQTPEQNEIKAQIMQFVEAAQTNEQIALSSFIPFEWEKVCMIGMGASSEYINTIIGVDWLNEKVYVPEQRQLFVFLRNEEVVGHLLFRPEIVGSEKIKDARLGVCISYSDAVFSVKEYRSSGGTVRLLMLPMG